MTKPYGASANAKAVREAFVERCLLRGASAVEIARQPRLEHVGLRTIQRDIQRISARWNKNNERQQMRSWAQADAEYHELWREGWTRLMDAQDDRLKLACQTELRNILNDRNKLAFPLPQPAPHPKPNATIPVTDEAVAITLNLLPTEMRTEGIESIRRRIAFLEKSS